MKRLVFLILSILTVFNASATEEQYSNRRSSSAFTSDFSFEVVDERYSELESGAFFDKSSKLLVRYGVDERTYYGYIPGFEDPGSTIDVKIAVTVEALDGIGTAIDSETVDMKVSYSPSEGAYQVDQAVFSFGGYNRYRISVSLPAAFPATPPENLYIEGELIVDRYYEIETTTPTIGASSVDFSAGSEATLIAGTIIPSETDEIELWWDYIEGAEEYELEWTWIDNYGETVVDDPLTAGELVFTERDFELNNTRVITPHQRYRIPMIYSRGFIIYRVRGVGRWIDDGFENIDKVKYGPWSTQDEDLTSASVVHWPDYLELEEVHEDGKNWQYQAVYAEDGKKKEIVSYFDGTLRNRQTTTRLNSNNEAIVGASIYDNQGRAAIQVLPAPVNNPTLRYYKGMNRNSAGDLYTHQDFDWESDVVGTACLTTSSSMNNLYGASYYYSQNPAAEGNWQDFVPDAEGYPFVHTIYTPDNTGRIRAQSGVGPAFAIGGELNEDDRDRSSQYFYGQPYQEELDRLFGYRVGYKTRYKKNMVVDANGQVSVSYMDPQGRVIATALAGDNTQAGDGIDGTSTNLHSLDEEMTGNHDEMTVDLLNKILPYGPDEENDDNLPFSSGEIGPFNDGFELNTQLINVSRDALHSFDYEVITDVYTDPCMDASIAYPFGYDVYIDMKDDCGVSVFGGPITKNVSGDDVSGTYIGATGVDYSGSGILPEFDDIEATLDVGSYTLEKRITLDKEKMMTHLDHYMINNICLLEKGDFFNSTVDCFDDLDPSDPDYLSDFEISSCFVRKHMMLGDVMPGGQYGATDGEDLTSVFTIDNALDWGAETSVKNWQNPIKDGVTSNYLNEFGEISRVIVDYNGDVPANPDDFSAEVSSDGIVWASLFGGLDYGTPGPVEVLPTHLLHVDDFIANWDPAWAEYLVEYHPEYKYLSDFYDNGTEGICTKVYPGTTILPDYSGGITSEQYDVALLTIETWSDANSTSNILGVDLVPVASASSWEIFDNDPFNNLQYPAIDLDGVTVTDEHYFRLDLLTEILQNHKSLSSPLSMFQFASKVVLCGGDIGASCGYSDSQLADPASITGITTEQLDQIWNTYKMYYISEKKRIIQLFEDVYSLRNGANYDTGASGPSFYNGYIESSSPTLPAITAFTDYPSFMESDGGERP